MAKMTETVGKKEKGSFCEVFETIPSLAVEWTRRQGDRRLKEDGRDGKREKKNYKKSFDVWCSLLARGL